MGAMKEVDKLLESKDPENWALVSTMIRSGRISSGDVVRLGETYPEFRTWYLQRWGGPEGWL